MRNLAIMNALRAKFAAPEWAWFEEVPNGTGGASRTRADGIAMNMWPSRGLEVAGFEVKVDRTDWKNEKKNPEKAETIARFCDRWWLVVDDLAVIGDHDVPGVWGIYLVKGGKVRVHREASELDAAPMSRAFVAALLRKGSEDTAEMRAKWTSPDALHELVRKRVAESVEEKSDAGKLVALQKSYDHLREWAMKVHEATGVYPGHDYNLPSLKSAVEMLHAASTRVRRFEQWSEMLREAANNIDAAQQKIAALEIPIAR